MDFLTLQNDFKNDYNKASIENTEFLEARKYYNGNQIPPDVLKIILERGQTPIVENMFKVIVNKILGYKIESISEIRLSPKQEEDRALSDLLNSLLQVFIQSENYDKAMIERDKNLLIGGLGVIQLWVIEDKDKNIEIDIKALKPESFVIDYFSTDKNALDARRFHKMLEITEQEAMTLFTGTTINYSFANNEKIATIIESWYKEYNEETQNYEWNRYLWNKSAGIYKSELKPFKNGACPFIVAKLYMDELNHYYGLFRDIKPMQDFINYAENRMGNMMGSFKAMFEEDAVVDVAEFVETMSLDNAIAKVRPNALKDNKIQFMNNQADLNALSQKAEQKRQLIRLLAGLNDESLGMAVNRQSGVAIAQRRESGLMGLQTFLKAADDMDRLIFKLAVSFTCEYFNKEQVFRIVDKKLGNRYFKINSSDDNRIRPFKFDLILKSQLKIESRDEKWYNWNELLKILAPIRPDLVPNLVPLMLNDMDSPITNDVLEAIQNANALQQQNAEANAPYNEQIQALQIQKLQAEIAELQAKASKYEQQGALSQTTNESEKINQAVAISEMQQQQNTDNNANNGNNKPSKKLKTSDKTTWLKYPSAQNLGY
ncbi:portal protein [Helicobacter pylori]|uniref:portal protein n=1 Tax=Helicobacter pylori TaxID=210 RepID=UPI000EB3FAF5|nr:portal protein [Helicobacter pylori]RKV02576.1 portal protein [Helicobacter pylori]WQX57629.1 phage portal protein [Helicobacter pylori]